MSSHKLRFSLLGLILAGANLAASFAFVLSRTPVDDEYLHELDNAKRSGWMSFNSAVSGIVACRIVSPWGEWHGDETWSVKVMEVANLDIIIPLIFFSLLLDTIASIPTCTQSWIIGIIFVTCATAQWYLFGRIIQRKIHGKKP